MKSRSFADKRGSSKPSGYWIQSPRPLLGDANACKYRYFILVKKIIKQNSNMNRMTYLRGRRGTIPLRLFIVVFI